MLNVLLVIHLLIAIGLVCVILLQRSEGGALGIGGGGGVMTGRAAGNLLTRTTAILATLFFMTSLGLALIANARSQPSSIMDKAPVSTAPAVPAAPAAPSAPLSR
jgi:preprotein translocase subunit SecG